MPQEQEQKKVQRKGGDGEAPTATPGRCSHRARLPS